MKQIHLCWENCQNARADLCPKIKDKIKKRIEDYKFITDGYQLYDERGNLDQFIVNVCKKYIKEQPKKLDYCETLQLKKDFITSYYNAENFQETPVYAELVKSKRN